MAWMPSGKGTPWRACKVDAVDFLNVSRTLSGSENTFALGCADGTFRLVSETGREEKKARSCPLPQCLSCSVALGARLAEASRCKGESS